MVFPRGGSFIPHSPTERLGDRRSKVQGNYLMVRAVQGKCSGFDIKIFATGIIFIAKDRAKSRVLTSSLIPGGWGLLQGFKN